MYNALKKHHLLKKLIRGWLYYTELKVSYSLLKGAIKYLKKETHDSTGRISGTETCVVLLLLGYDLLKQFSKKESQKQSGNPHHKWTQRVDEEGNIWFSNETGYTFCKKPNGTISTINNLRG